LLDVQNLRMHFKTQAGMVHAVDDVSFKINDGQAVGLVGESGSGKTATAHTIIRLLPPNARVLGGKILLDGQDLLKLNPQEMRQIRGKRVAMVFQDPFSFLNPVLRIGDQVGEVLRIHKGHSKSKAREQVVELLKLVQIPAAEDVVNRYPHQMSGGMRQRAVIAAALACDPEIVIFDEPTTALDATVQAQLIELIKDLKKRLGMSILLITHDLGVVAEICDYVYVMYAGMIVESSEVRGIYKNPQHPYTQGLLRSNISILNSSQVLETIEGMPPNLLVPPSGCRFNPRCLYVMNKCRTDEPPMLDINGEHGSRYWLNEAGRSQ